MHNLRTLSLILACLTVITGGLLVGTAAVGGFSDARPTLDDYLRSREVADGQRLVLDVAVQQFEPGEAPGPTVYLVAAVHVGEQAYYDRLQAFLDTCDLVLFEGVGPYGTSAWQPDGDTERLELTQMRLRSLAAAVYGYWKEHGEAPATLDALATSGSADDAFLLSRLRADGWGNAMIYAPPSSDGKDKGVIMSFGADGEPGGEGLAADVRFADLPPLTASEKGTAQGIQTKLARALGLQFQLDAIDYDRAHFQRTDMSMDELERALRARGIESNDLFGMLQGSSPLVKIADLALTLLRMSSTMQHTVRAVLIKVVAISDEVMESAGGDQAGMMRVLIEDRNRHVLELLAEALEHSDAKRIAVVYGAGHLPDLAHRLEREFGYEPGETQWFTAFGADLSRTGMTAEQLDALMDQALEQIKSQR